MTAEVEALAKRMTQLRERGSTDQQIAKELLMFIATRFPTAPMVEAARAKSRCDMPNTVGFSFAWRGAFYMAANGDIPELHRPAAAGDAAAS